MLEAKQKKPPESPNWGPMRAPTESECFSAELGQGKVVWYISFAGNSYKQLARAFEIQYLEIKIEVFRAANKELLTKITAENQTKRYIADTLESTLGFLNGLRENLMLACFTSPHANAYAAFEKKKASADCVYGRFIGKVTTRSVITTDVIPPMRRRESLTTSLIRSLEGRWAFRTAWPWSKPRRTRMRLRYGRFYS
ncbi:MAG: hypothetical protein ACREQO_01865 [Candidatus Binatia bacterium]